MYEVLYYRWSRHSYVNLTKIGISNKHRKRPKDNHWSFDEMEVNPHLYPDVLVIALPVIGATVQKVLVDTRSSLNIRYVNTLKWMGIPLLTTILKFNFGVK